MHMSMGPLSSLNGEKVLVLEWVGRRDVFVFILLLLLLLFKILEFLRPG